MTASEHDGRNCRMVSPLSKNEMQCLEVAYCAYCGRKIKDRSGTLNG